MSERGMIFNAEMVNAILSGRKTQTRRPIKWKQTRFTEIAERDDGSLWPWAEDCERGGDIWFACPYGEIGDRIWVRETWQVIHDHIDESSHVEYRTYAPSIPKEKDRYWHTVYAEHFGDESREDRGFPWRPAIHMPRWASRILLEITDVRVERLRGLSEEDAKSEGIIPSAGGVLPGWEYRINFRDLWMDIYGTDNWEANPWVWVIEFKRVEGGAA
ncbi:TPA: hypothetical protein P5L79_002824 [Salmonella enterica subsp. enterica serovar Concord]|nr:hypothetical protein [Salmonella enterica subsp. enterica serovar Poona]EDA8516231.1 hypothetical protein [Salmonella enterica subsp. enterica serovar Poona]EEC7160758.1 hypothetical protein [Salmonella enterica subsp. enterica serovar Braenderup]SUH58753.1 Uncharacterised protein [Salmonella enterica subsp. enterica serovar Braenderup]HDO8458856.1 hypothetical protein [Salmonella enterica subsp. enterica serovar Concord]